MSRIGARYIIKGEFFPPHFRLLGSILIIFSILIWDEQAVQNSLIFFLIGFPLLCSRFGLIINTKNKTIKKYFSIFLIRIGVRKRYDLLTCFWLTSHRMKDVWQNPAIKTESHVYGVVNVYLITSDGDSFYVLQEKTKQGVYERLAKFMNELNISCLDKYPTDTK
ncbi:hypothetical protein [Ekhidna sp. To15]|uniref:hypothetical protein n=1 Tax=Ekhidna sp. To15 TaxID=3395267 RepID=UPI003F51AE26